MNSDFSCISPDLQELLNTKPITEILLNGPDSIWCEIDGALSPSGFRFKSLNEYRQFFEFVSLQAHLNYNLEHPVAMGKYLDFRVQIVDSALTQGFPIMSLRRHPESPWNFTKLAERQWASPEGITQIKSILMTKKNFLVVGTTGTGKTSILNACLQELSPNERLVIIEDTSEIALPNTASVKLLTRPCLQGGLPEFDQTALVKQSLRLRPDRIWIGEIRGNEAKDLLMALSTGHAGSGGTLHAHSAQQALIRLEMLIQMGAPQWEIKAIRSLIYMSLQNIIVVGKNIRGQRYLEGIYCLSSHEDSGILLDRTF